MRSSAAVVFAVLALAGLPAAAEVLDSGPGGFTLSHKVTIAAPPAAVWAALKRIGGWWDPEHTYSGDARNMALEARPGGLFSETVPGGGGVEHMTVVAVFPEKMLRLQGGLGPLQAFGVNGSLTFAMKPDGAGTVLLETYDVGGHAPGGLDKLAAPVDAVLTAQVQRLVKYAEGGARP